MTGRVNYWTDGIRGAFRAGLDRQAALGEDQRDPEAGR